MEESRLVVERAEIDPGNISFNPKANTNWTAILREANKHEKVDDLIHIASSDYPAFADKFERAKSVLHSRRTENSTSVNSFLVLLKNPAVIGPVGAALIAASVAIYLNISKKDKTPPLKPSIVDIQRTPDQADQLLMKYEGAQDSDDGSGLKEVRLWYRHESSDEWKRTDSASTGPSGEVFFDKPPLFGLYYFDLVALDQSGNKTADPSGTYGQKRFQFQNSDIGNLLEARPTNAEVLLANAEPSENWVHIPTLFHLVGLNQLSDTMNHRIHKQLSVLNDSFKPGKIAFSLAGIETAPGTQFNGMRPGSAIEKQMKLKLSKSTDSQLNVYITNTEYNVNGRLISWSSFPWDLQQSPELDGCVVIPSSLPGGDPPFHLGNTLVHCVGHWLSLYHTFQGGCHEPNGDYVEDTPSHATANFGKPVDASSCNGANAPVENFMNYTDDSEEKQFTTGQFLRMQKAIVTFREELL